MAKIHPSRRKFYRLKGKYWRLIDHKLSDLLIHKSVKTRWDRDPKYRPENLKEYIEKNGWPSRLVELTVGALFMEDRDDEWPAIGTC